MNNKIQSIEILKKMHDDEIDLLKQRYENEIKHLREMCDMHKKFSDMNAHFAKLFLSILKTSVEALSEVVVNQ